MKTLDGWRSTATTRLMQQLPLQSPDVATEQVSTQLAQTGGWKPEKESDPTGAGAPVSGETPEEAVAKLVEAQLEQVKVISATVTVDVDIDMVANAGSTGDPNTDGTLLPAINDFLQKQLGDTALVKATTTKSKSVTYTTGNMNPDTRQALVKTISGGSYQNNPLAVALMSAKSSYSLSDNWNVSSVYTEAGKPIVVTVREYTETTKFDTLKSSTDKQYVMVVDPVGYRLISGSSSPVIA